MARTDETHPAASLPAGGTLRSLHPSEIHRDARLQPRAIIDPEQVERYLEAMRAGDAFPPVIVFADGQHNWLADGFTRTLAAEKLAAGDADADVSLEAWVIPGHFRDAWMYSRGANAAHGYPRTRADLQRAIDSLLVDDECRGWTNERLAQIVRGTDGKAVERRRLALEGAGEIPYLDKLEAADGKSMARRRKAQAPDPMAGANQITSGLTGRDLIGKDTPPSRPAPRVVVDDFAQDAPDEGPVVHLDAEIAEDDGPGDTADEGFPIARREPTQPPALVVAPAPDFARPALRDVDDVPVPDNLRPVFDAFATHHGAVEKAFEALIAITGRLLGDLRLVPDLMGGERMAALEAVPQALAAARLAFNRARPIRVCTPCKGERCRACGGRGWLPDHTFTGGR